MLIAYNCNTIFLTSRAFDRTRVEPVNVANIFKVSLHKSSLVNLQIMEHAGNSKRSTRASKWETIDTVDQGELPDSEEAVPRIQQTLTSKMPLSPRSGLVWPSSDKPQDFPKRARPSPVSPATQTSRGRSWRSSSSKKRLRSWRLEN